MKVALKYLLPNPFRNIEEYPINKEKVEQLKISIKETGFWGNILCRKKKRYMSSDKFYEIAYGHHRKEALRQLFNDDKEIDVIVQDLTDEMMLRIMANENDERYNCLPAVIDETVKSARDYLLANKDVARKLLSSVYPERKRLKIGAPLIAKFLGENWTQNRVELALERITVLEKGEVSRTVMYSMPTTTASTTLIRALKKAQNPLFKLSENNMEEIARGINETERYGEESIKRYVFDYFHWRKKQPKEAVDIITYTDSALWKAVKAIEKANLHLRDFGDGVEQKGVIFHNTPTIDDISPNNIKRYHDAVGILGGLVEKVEKWFKDMEDNKQTEEEFEPSLPPKKTEKKKAK